MNSLLVWIRWFPLYQHSNSYPKQILNSEVTSDMLLVTYQNPEKKKKLVSSDRFERAPFSVANEKKSERPTASWNESTRWLRDDFFFVGPCISHPRATSRFCGLAVAQLSLLIFQT